MELTNKQRMEICAEEAKYQLDIMGQYLNKEDKKFFITLLKKYTNMLEASKFLTKNNIKDVDG